MTLVRGRCDDVTRAFAPGAACDGDRRGGERRDVSIGISSRDEYVGEHRGGAQAGFDAVTHREAQHAGEEDREDRSERGDHRGWFFLETGRLTPWFARVRSDGGAGALIHLFISGVGVRGDATLGWLRNFTFFPSEQMVTLGYFGNILER